MWGRWLLKIFKGYDETQLPIFPVTGYRRELFRKQSALIAAQRRYTQSLLFPNLILNSYSKYKIIRKAKNPNKHILKQKHRK